MKHNWEFNGIDIHKHEYWYKCKNCGSQDWIASYGTLDQLYPKECVAKKQHTESLTDGEPISYSNTHRHCSLIG